VDDSSVLGYDALDEFERWASEKAPLMFAEFDQATLFSGSVHCTLSLGPPTYIR